MLQESRRRDEEAEHVSTIHHSNLLYSLIQSYRKVKSKAIERVL
jgi:hypothetical protein